MAKRTLTLPTSYEFAVSPSQTYVVSLGRNVVLANLKERKRIASWHPLSHPSHVDFCPSESRFAVKSSSGEIVVVSVPDGKVMGRHVPAGHDEGPGPCFSPCGAQVVEGSWGGFIRVRSSVDLTTQSVFSFPGEMINVVSTNLRRDNWLFVHQPKTKAGENFPGRPYLTLWQWPLLGPSATLPLGVHSVDAAALSPCGTFIAMTAYSRSAKATELHVMNLRGQTIRSTPILTGGTGARMHWSSDGRLIGTVRKDGFSVFSSSTLSVLSEMEMEYPSDLVFLQGGKEILLGTWQAGVVAELVDCSDIVKSDAQR